MDMALAARGDFLAVSTVELSGRAAVEGVGFAEGAGALALVGEDLAADVTGLDAGFEETVFLTGNGFLATGVFLAGTAFLAVTGFFETTAFLAGTTFLATIFLLAGFFAITFFATTFFATDFLAADFLGVAFFTTTAFFVGVGFLVATVFFTTATFLAGALTILDMGLALVALVLLLALLSLECFVDFNANLLTGWRRVR